VYSLIVYSVIVYYSVHYRPSEQGYVFDGVHTLCEWACSDYREVSLQQISGPLKIFTI